MQEQPSIIQREAKSLLAGLKELTKKKNGLLDKEVDFQRKNLRSQYLRLLLSYPYAKESKDVETHLWMQTSYQFISFYKQKIATLDRKLFPSPVRQGQGRNGKQEGRGENGLVEYRRVLQRFRQFLAEEEKFYSVLLVRLRKVFDLHDVQPTLAKLDLQAVDNDDPVSKGKGRDVLPEQQEIERPSQDQRENVVVIFGKFLVCLGDIARYREHYNDNDGRPRAGSDHMGTRKASSRGGKKGLDPTPRPRNYSRSRVIYEQARLLVPEDGNASHQLAVLSTYEKDNFATLYHYYRALCVRCPYDPASGNLTNVLRKAAEQYRTSNRDEINDGARRDPKLRLARFKSWVVLLHGLWYLDNDETASKATKLAKNVGLEFAALITDRVLQPDTISQVVILSLGALWKLRIVRDTVKPLESSRNKLVEPLMVMHIMDLAQSLFSTGSALLLENADMQDKEDLGQRIPAVLRRTLPSIRIFMKWLRSNLSYVLTVNSTNASTENLQNAVGDFWTAWARFFSALMGVFPIVRLPTSKGPLEEDIEMSGFSPIKRHMVVQPDKTGDGLAPNQAQVHPNEEFLMRISDLIKDAQTVSTSEGCPVVLAADKFVVNDNTGTDRPAITSPVGGLEDIMERHPNPPRLEIRNDDESTTQTSRTEDDLVGDAVRAALAAGAIGEEEEDDDDDDQIVWAPKQLESPQLTPASVATDPFTPVRAPLNNLSSSESKQHTTTAQDLLNGVLGNNVFGRTAVKSPFNFGIVDPSAFNSTNSKLHDSISVPTQSSLLFGSGSPRAPTTSIWSNLEGELVSNSAIANHGSALQHGHFPPDRFPLPTPYSQLAPVGVPMQHSGAGLQYQGMTGAGGKSMIPPTNMSFLSAERMASDRLLPNYSRQVGDISRGNVQVLDQVLDPFINHGQVAFVPDPSFVASDVQQAVWNKR